MHENEETDSGAPAWMVTFGDMMSLLLTFFIVLISMSEPKYSERSEATLESIRGQFGNEKSKGTHIPDYLRPRSASLVNFASAQRTRLTEASKLH